MQPRGPGAPKTRGTRQYLPPETRGFLSLKPGFSGLKFNQLWHFYHNFSTVKRACERHFLSAQFVKLDEITTNKSFSVMQKRRQHRLFVL